MLYPAELLKEVISGLNATITFSRVDVVTGGWKCYTTNTAWFYTGNTVDIGGNLYFVESFVWNEYLVLTNNENELVINKPYELTAPTFKHGKLKATTIEMLNRPEQRNYFPIVWMFELSPRGGASDVDTVFESTGSVRMFIMNTASYSDYTTQDHYTNVINPLSNLVKLLLNALKAHKRTGKIFTNTNLPHAKFTNDTGETDSEGNNILPFELSGIELDIDLPIKFNLNCFSHN